MIIKSNLNYPLDNLEYFRKKFITQRDTDGLILLPSNFEIVNDDLTEELKALVLDYDNKHSDDYFELLDKLKTLVIKYC